MKRRMLVVIIGLVVGLGPLTAASFAQDGDKKAIETTVGYYITALDTGDVAALEKAFYPQARLQQAINGSYVQITFQEFAERVKAPPAPNAVKPNWRKITSVDVFGNVAIAKVENDFPAFYLVDYLTLLKVDGTWKVVNKAFHRQAK